MISSKLCTLYSFSLFWKWGKEWLHIINILKHICVVICLFTVFGNINTFTILIRCAMILVFFQKPFSSGKMIPKRQVVCSSIFKFLPLKRLVQPKVKLLSSFTHPHNSFIHLQITNEIYIYIIYYFIYIYILSSF